MKVSYVQLGSSTSGGVYVARRPVVSVAHIHDVFEDMLWYQSMWYINDVPYCRAVNRSYCLLTFNSAGNYSVSVAATVLANVTTDARSALMKKKSEVIEHHLLVKGKKLLECFFLGTGVRGLTRGLAILPPR